MTDIRIGYPEFVRLQKKWYRKLKTDGFVDIEAFDEDGNPYDTLRGDPSMPTPEPLNSEKTAVLEEALNGTVGMAYEYYLRFRQYARELELSRKRTQEDWIICNLFGEGESVSKIADFLEISETALRRRIKRLESDMGMERGRRPGGA